MARSLALGLVCLFLIAAASAQAAERRAPDVANSTERIIDLTDGSLYRGELLEYVPKDHVTLRLSSGEVRRFPWAQIKRVALVASTGQLVPLPRRERPAVTVAPVEPAAPLPPPPVLSGPPQPEPASENAQSRAKPPGGQRSDEDEDQDDSPATPTAKLRYEEQMKAAAEQVRNEDYSAAEESYQRIRQTYNDTRSLYALAKTQQKTGQFYEAYQNYRQYLAQDPTLSPGKRELVHERAEGALLRHRTFDSLPPDLKKDARLFSFVAIETDNPAAKLQFLADSISFEGWSYWAGYMSITSEKWSTICKNECNKPVYRQAVLRITGDTIVPSADFSLPPTSRDVTLTVKTGSRTRRAAAWGLLITGAVLSAVGISVAAAEAGQGGSAGTGSGNAIVGMLGLAAGGAGVMIGSLPLFLTSRTRVTAD